MENLAEFLTVLSCGLFAGAALYVSLVAVVSGGDALPVGLETALRRAIGADCAPGKGWSQELFRVLFYWQNTGLPGLK
jgi:hypothetical protein